MSHGPNRYRAERRDAELVAGRAGPDAPPTPAVVRAQRIIAVWNSRARQGRPAEYFPTFETVLTAGCWRLTYCCPGCRQMATIDIRELAEAHHPRAPISMLIPKLSCERCCPNPPLVVLIELESPSAELPISVPAERPNVTMATTYTVPVPPVPTLGELQKAEPHWLWLHCGAIDCSHKEPVALAQFVIRWGPDTPSDRLRNSMRCKKCNHKGVATMVASTISFVEGYEPFPMDGKRYMGPPVATTWGMRPPGDYDLTQTKVKVPRRRTRKHR